MMTVNELIDRLTELVAERPHLGDVLLMAERQHHLHEVEDLAVSPRQDRVVLEVAPW